MRLECIVLHGLAIAGGFGAYIKFWNNGFLQAKKRLVTPSLPSRGPVGSTKKSVAIFAAVTQEILIRITVTRTIFSKTGIVYAA
jgi:hypothetical protein